MSLVAMAWAWGQQHRLGAAEGKILLALADHADESGECWPSVKSLARKCGMSGRTVQRWLRELEKGGLIRSRHRFVENRQTSSLYTLAMVGDGLSARGDAPATPGMTPLTPAGVTQSSPKSSIESSNEPSSPNPALDHELVDRVASAILAGTVRSTKPYLVAAMRSAGLTTNGSAVGLYLDAVSHSVASQRAKTELRKQRIEKRVNRQVEDSERQRQADWASLGWGPPLI